MRKLALGLMAAIALGAAPAFAQEAPPRPNARNSDGEEAPPAAATARHDNAQAAGYRAIHFCTGLFSTKQSKEMLEGTGGPRPTRAKANRMEVDEKAKTVSVWFSDDMEPRIAHWRPNLGCTQLPIGAKKEAIAQIPRMADSVKAPNFDAQPWPQGDQNATAELPAAKKAAVEKILDEAFKGESGPYLGATWGVVVIKDGKIVAERYSGGFDMHTPSRTNSMCKSVSATLVGIGVKKGLLDIHKKAPLKEWRRPGDPRGEITLNDLLHMGSGLYTESSGNPQQELYQSGATAAETSALGRVDSKPGTRYVYAGSDTILATRALRQAVNDDAKFLSFPHKELLWKIGMTRTILETDWNGDFLISGQCWSTARDFGRFGLLYLANGAWKGEQILPTNWAKYVATPAPAQPATRLEGGFGYGAQFWLYGGVEGLPDGVYSPNGARGQYAVIVPSENIVVVRRGIDPTGKGFRIARFASNIVTAIKQ